MNIKENIFLYALVIILFIPSLSFSNEKDWYYECMEIAESEKNITTPVITGIASGLLLNALGPLVGYTIIDNSNPKVPYELIKELDSNQRKECEKGYKEVIIRNNTNKFLVGGVLGFLTSTGLFIHFVIEP
jgi:hypothetical protein